MLKSLSTEEKRILIRLLTQSLREETKRQKEPGMHLSTTVAVKHTLVNTIEKHASVSGGKKGKPEGQQMIPAKANWIDTFYGSWNDTSETAEELIQLIEGSRTTGRDNEAL